MPQPRVQSLERALDLLEALAGTDEVGVSELAAQTGLVPSTAHRLLATLVSRGYAAQSAASGRYLLGYKLLELTSGLHDRLERLRVAARPHLEAIMERTGETTNLVVLEGRSAVYIDSVSGTRSVRLFTEIGQAIPAHSSGSGKALLAWADVEALFGADPLPASTPHTLTSLGRPQRGPGGDPPPRLRHRRRGARAGRRLRGDADPRPRRSAAGGDQHLRADPADGGDGRALARPPCATTPGRSEPRDCSGSTEMTRPRRPSLNSTVPAARA